MSEHKKAPIGPAETAEQWADRMASSELSHMEAVNAGLPLPVAPAGDREAVANPEKHPNNRLLFKRLVAAAGIKLGEDDIASALAKVGEMQRRLDAQPAEERAVVDRFSIRLPDGNTAEVRPNADHFGVWLTSPNHVDGGYWSAWGLLTFADAVRNIMEAVWPAAEPGVSGEQA